MRKKIYFLAFLIMAAIPAVSAWGQQAKPPAKKALKPIGQQDPAVANQTLTAVRGYVKYKDENKGVEGIEMTLSDVSSPAWKLGTKTKSDGSYLFGNLKEKLSKTLKITAAQGLSVIFFAPNDMKFVLVSGFNTMKDILFTPPDIRIKVQFKTPDGVVIPDVKFTIYEIINSQEKAVPGTQTTNSEGYCWFAISSVKIGRDFVIRATDRKYKKFDPVEQRFKLADNDPHFVFRDAGWLPDLVATPVMEYFDQNRVRKVSFIVKNQGLAASGVCYLRFKYKEYDSKGDEVLFWGTGPEPLYFEIPALAPGASFTTRQVIATEAGVHIHLISSEVDPDNRVGESNGNNNIVYY